jgi:hypothetical protein
MTSVTYTVLWRNSFKPGLFHLAPKLLKYMP